MSRSGDTLAGGLRAPSAFGVSVLHDAPLLGQSAAFRSVIEMADEAARSNCSVICEGESGVGKSRLAKEIHLRSPRSGGPFIICSVADLPPTLVQGELVGHKRGAFSGADSDKLGLLQAAHEGDVVLDDVDKLPFTIQPNLHRFLDDHEVRPIGASRAVRVNVRVIATTNQNLAELVDRGLFMRDLMNRLGEMEIQIPPLRERRDDIRLLVDYLLNAYSLEQRRPTPSIHPVAMRMFEDASWPGNSRDVAKAVLYCVQRSKGELITPEIAAGAPGLAEPKNTPAAELARLASLPEDERRSKPIVLRALELTRWRFKDAAGALSIPYRTFQRDCQRLGIRLRSKAEP